MLISKRLPRKRHWRSIRDENERPWNPGRVRFNKISRSNFRVWTPFAYQRQLNKRMRELARQRREHLERLRAARRN